MSHSSDGHSLSRIKLENGFPNCTGDAKNTPHCHPAAMEEKGI
jgi:hypothetical protein